MRSAAPARGRRRTALAPGLMMPMQSRLRRIAPATPPIDLSARLRTQPPHGLALALGHTLRPWLQPSTASGKSAGSGNGMARLVSLAIDGHP